MRRAGSLAAIALVGAERAIAFGTPLVGRVDQAVLLRGTRVVSADPARGEAVAKVTPLGDPPAFAVMALVTVGGAWAARGRVSAGRCVAVLAGANLTTQVLQPLFSGPRDLPMGSHLSFVYPSGHTTGVASIGVCLPGLFAGRARAPAAAAAAGLVLSMSSALVCGGTHLVSDVVAALLIVAAWAFAVGPSARS